MRPDPVDGPMVRGALFGCGIEALVGIALLLIVVGIGLLAGWWTLR